MMGKTQTIVISYLFFNDFRCFPPIFNRLNAPPFSGTSNHRFLKSILQHCKN